jgi:RimJ/RimL family protein N-acetyltransferase
MTMTQISSPNLGTAPEILTARTRMRGHHIADFDAMVAMWRDDIVTRYILGRPSTASETWSRLLRYVGHWQALGFGYWAIEDRDTGRFIGEVGFAEYKRDIEPSLDDAPEAGWVLVPEVHGKGIATEVMTAALDWADRTFSDPKTVCIFDPAHQGSMRVAEKLGYRPSHVATFMDKPTQVMTRLRPGD